MLRVSNLSASLILSSLCVSLASLFILELANSLADVYYSQVSRLGCSKAVGRMGMPSGNRCDWR